MTLRRTALAAGFLLISAAPALAAEGLDGRTLGLPWAIPFVGMLLSIAVLPLVAHDFWHHHRGKVAAFWALLTILPIALTGGAGTAAAAVVLVVPAYKAVSPSARSHWLPGADSFSGS